jgi:type II secretory pathway pseudopilin PulG
MSKMQKLKSGCKGFSLLELMFGVSVLLTVVTGSLVSFMNCMFLNEFNRHLAIAANDAQYALEQIKAQNFSNIQTFIGNPNNFSRAKNLPAANNETITFAYTQNNLVLNTITIQVSWNERQAAKTFSITTRFAQ